MITYQNLAQLSGAEISALTKRFRQGAATTITVVIENDGEITVLSPCSAEVTQYNLISIGVSFPTQMAMN